MDFRTDYHHDFANDQHRRGVVQRGLGLDLDAMWFSSMPVIRTYVKA